MKRSKLILIETELRVLQRQQAEFTKAVDCDHEWHKFGHGFRCKGCDKYTGMHEELNEAISKELKL